MTLSLRLKREVLKGLDNKKWRPRNDGIIHMACFRQLKERFFLQEIRRVDIEVMMDGSQDS